MAKMLKESNNIQRVETTVELDNENWFSKMESLVNKYILEEQTDEECDDVDGITDDVLKPLVKLYFLKILLIDIGISCGDLVTDLLQSLNLMFDSNWNVLWSTYHYGCIMLFIIWMPAIPMLLHIATTEKSKYFINQEESVRNLVTKILLFVILFPFLPTLMYLKLLIMRKSFPTNRDKLKFLSFEQKTTELKAIVGSTESTLQMIMMVWLMSRGILTLPWDQPLSSSCVEDSLGRVACLPSVPVLSLIFSLLSILKSVFDINLVPHVKSSLHHLAKSQVCQHIVLCFFPFFLCNIMFRLPAYAFILTFIDYWSVIPAVILFILNLACCGVFFIKTEKNNDEEFVPMDNIIEEDENTADIQNKSDNPELIWNGEEWMSSSILNKDLKLRPVKSSEVMKEGDSSSGKDQDHFEEEDLRIEDMINEQNSSLLLNSVSGFFFPCVHTRVCCHDSETRTQPGQTNPVQFSEKLLAWQMKVISTQVWIFNIGIIIVLISIFVLVTFVQSFNYKQNIFNFSWFTIIVVYLISAGVVSIVWSLKIYPAKAFPLIETQNNETEQITSSSTSQRRRHITGESNTASIYSATNSMIQTGDRGPGKIKEKFIFCLLTSLMTLAPIIFMISCYKLFPTSNIFIVQLQESDDGHYLANIVGSYHQIGLDTENLTILTNFTFVNMTHYPSDQTSGVLIFQDIRPEYKWRASSPVEDILAHSETKMILTRLLDFEMMPETFKQSKRIALVSSLTDISDVYKSLTRCTRDSEIIISNRKGKEEEINKKYLFSNGSIIEYKSVKENCVKDGHPCDIRNTNDYDNHEDDENIVKIATECSEPFSESINLLNENGEMKNGEAIIANGRISSYCCFNSSHSVSFYGDECDNLQFDYLQNICKFSQYFLEGTCDKHGVQTKTQICRVHGLNCVLKRSYLMTCRGFNLVEACLIDSFPCFKEQ